MMDAAWEEQVETIKGIVFFGLVFAVIVGIFLTILGNRRRHREATLKTEAALRKAEDALQHNLNQRRRRREVPSGEDGAAEGNPDRGSSAGPGKGQGEGSFNPDATQAYMRDQVVADRKVITDRPEATSQQGGTLQLICLGGPNRGRHYPVPAIGLSIGRADDNDLVIVDSRVSSHHAWIGRVEDRVMLRDYQSLNGTFINADMNTPIREVGLVHGDTILFGGHGGSQFRFVID